MVLSHVRVHNKNVIVRHFSSLVWQSPCQDQSDLSHERVKKIEGAKETKMKDIKRRRSERSQSIISYRLCLGGVLPHGLFSLWRGTRLTFGKKAVFSGEQQGKIESMSSINISELCKGRIAQVCGPWMLVTSTSLPVSLSLAPGTITPSLHT